MKYFCPYTYIISIIFVFFKDLIEKIEDDKESAQENYWLIQYQKLLDSKPAGILKAEQKLEPKVSN